MSVHPAFADPASPAARGWRTVSEPVLPFFSGAARGIPGSGWDSAPDVTGHGRVERDVRVETRADLVRMAIREGLAEA